MTTITSIFDHRDPSTPGFYGPSQTALLLLDFHSSFVNQAGGPQAPAALATACRMREWAIAHSISVVHCLIDLDATPFSTCKDAKRFASAVAAMRMSGGGGEEPAELSTGKSSVVGGNGHDNEPRDFVFHRRPGYVSALKSPGLREFLQEGGFKSLILTGLSTSGCVARTAITAGDEEYVVSIISDACADADETLHKVMIEKVLNSRGYVMTAAEFEIGYDTAQDKRRNQ